MDQEETNNIEGDFSLDIKRVAIFNKISGALVGMVNVECKDQINDKYFKFKEIEIDETTQRFVGDYDSGEVVSIDDAPVVVTESQLNHACATAIENVFPLYKQLNALTGVMKSIISKHDLQGEEVNEFNKVVNFISGRRNLNKKFKTAYKEGPDWEYISTEDEGENFNKVVEGGIHEDIGPRSTAYMPCGLDGD